MLHIDLIPGPSTNMFGGFVRTASMHADPEGMPRVRVSMRVGKVFLALACSGKLWAKSALECDLLSALCAGPSFHA